MTANPLLSCANLFLFFVSFVFFPFLTLVVLHFVENQLWIAAALQCIPNSGTILIILCRHQHIFPVRQCPHNTGLVMYRMVRPEV